MEEHKSHKGALFFLLAVAVLASFLFWQQNSKLNQVVVDREIEIEQARVAVAELTLEAKAVSVYDISSGIKIYGKNDDASMPLASLAKAMTVALAVNSFEPEEIISISEEALKQAGDFGLFLHEKWKVEDLAKLTLISSANDGAFALGEKDSQFLEKMNTKAKKIGMENFSFMSLTGLDLENALPSAYASAYDVNLMVSYAMRTRPEIFFVTTKPEITLISESGFTHTFKNTNIMTDKIPNLLFSKTGFTDAAGGNLTIVFKNKDGHLIAVTVLGSTFEGRFVDMEKIVNALYSL